MERRANVTRPELLAPSALKALGSALPAFDWRSQERGEDYAARGAVTRVVVDEKGARASVRGTRVYHTQWTWDAEGRCVPSCSCPVAPHCKHTYALACVLLGDESVAGNDLDFDENEFPFEDVLVDDEILLEGDDVVEPHRARETRRGRTSRPRTAGTRSSAPSPLDLVRRATVPWERQTALQLLLIRAPVPGLAYDQGILSVLEEPDPELRCWRLALVLARQTNGWVPPELAPYRDQPALAARHRARAQRVLASELVEWGRRRGSAPRRQLRVVLGLTIVPGGAVTVTAEVRVTTPRLVDAPRRPFQLQQLRSEIRRNPSLVSPEQAMLLELVLDPSGARDVGTPALWMSGAALRSFLARVAAPGLATSVSWREDLPADLAVRAGLRARAPVRFASEPARLVPMCVSGDDGPCIDLAFVWPDGRQCPHAQAVHIAGSVSLPGTEPSLVLESGEFSLVVEEPPRTLIQRFTDAGVLPLPAGEREEVLGALAAGFPHIQESARPHTRFHRVAPTVTLDLRDEDWMHVRIFAHGDARFEYQTAIGWRRLARGAAAIPVDAAVPLGEPAITSPGGDFSIADPSVPAPPHAITDSEVWIEAPYPPDVEAAVAWLVAIDARPATKGPAGAGEPPCEDRHLGWWMRTDRKKMEAFADAWEQRPRGVTFLGTERVRRLLATRERVTPRIRITASGVDWLAITPAWESEGAQLSDADLAKLRGATSRFVRLAGGWVRRDITVAHDEGAALLADLGIEADGGEQRLTLWHLAGAKAESVRALVHLGADPATARALERLRKRVASFRGLPRVAPPAGLDTTLRPYQQQGLEFLAYASSLGLGAVLADDMGLGKTVQALAWVLRLRALAPHDGPTLVVCPASVVHNWLREAERFAPELRVLLLTSGSGRHALRRAIPEHDLLVTTYALLRRDLDAWREIELRAVILDEAQNIKNPDAVVAGAARQLRARHRLALTGTPLENRALDLWSIVSFVNPGYLGSRAEFSARFDRPDAPPHARTLLAAKLRPILLRRLKRDVAPELPDRIEERRDCELTTGQRQLYLGELRRSRALVDELGAEPGKFRRNKITILAALTRLRQICCHPALGGGRTSLGSGKFEALFELLEPLMAEGHKVLLFSQFVRCLQLLRTELAARGIACHLLTGATVKRESVVRAFSIDERPCVFLVSLKAGGTGLNLTSASYVVLFDPWWNPAVEAQAIDRTHRIGQDRTVVAYRLLALGTIEEKIFELQQRKAALARDVLGEDGFARALTRDDLAYLLADS